MNPRHCSHIHSRADEALAFDDELERPHSGERLIWVVSAALRKT